MSLSQIKAIYGAVVLAIILPFLVTAQQYLGTPIANQSGLLGVPGANITWFNIQDPANKNATLTNYVSFNSSGRYMPPSAMKRLVIVIHGLNRDPGTYMANLLVALSNTANKEATIDNTQILAPYFPNGDDKNIGYPWTDGLSPGKGSTSSALVWQASYWSQGDNAQYPYNRANVSSFAVMDQIINYYGNLSLFPNLNQIVVSGHSLGAQMVQRYAAVGMKLSTTVPVSYWVGNPNSYLWFNSDRPLDYSTCPTYNDWRNGFSNYSNTYQATFASSPSKVLARYNSRRLNYARGLQDTGDDSTTCAPYSQGQNRNERFFEFIKAFPPTSAHTIDYNDCGHDFSCMSQSDGGQQRLFHDNFKGDGSFAPDFYCPRQQIGDDPNPSPSCGVTRSPADSGSFNGYTYKGCYTDQAPATLPYMAFSGWANASASLCTASCKAAGYSIAGLEYGNQCFCANGLGASTYGPLVEAGCSMTCSGNSHQICGDLNRLSIFSTQSNVTTYAAPAEPLTISVPSGPYSYIGCYTEASAGRALGSDSTVSSSNTPETCVSYCASKGYVYAGVEYGDECYCGNSIASSASVATSGCNMLCPGSNFEYCGGPNRLNVWHSNATIVSSTTSAGSTATMTSSSISTATTMSCPASDGKSYTASNGNTFNVQCFVDHPGGDLGSVQTNSLDACLNACASTSGCLAVSYLPGSPGPCYMHNTLTSGTSNGAVWGAVLSLSNSSSTVSPTSSTVSATSTTSTSATMSPTASATLSCPSSNGTRYSTTNGNAYQVLCYLDNAGADLSSASTSSLDSCLQVCSATSGCVAVSWVPGSPGVCYMHSAFTTLVPNAGVYGAQLVSNGSTTTSSSLSSSSSTASMITSTSSLVNSTSAIPTVISSSGSSSVLASSSSVMNSTTSTIATSMVTSTSMISTSLSSSMMNSTTSTSAPSVISTSLSSSMINSTSSKSSTSFSASLTSSSSMINSTTSTSATSMVTSTSTMSTSSSSSMMNSTTSTSAPSVTSTSSSSSMINSTSLQPSTISSSSLTSSSSMINSTTSTSAPLVTSTSSKSSTSTSASLASSSSMINSTTSTFATSMVTSISVASTSSSSSMTNSTSSKPSTSPSTSLASSSSMINSTTSLSATSMTTFSSTTTKATSTPPSTTSSSSTSSTTISLPTGYTPLGCYTDSSVRTFPVLAYKNSSNSPSFCAKACTALNYPLSGTEYGNECWCGNTLASTTLTSISTSTACTSPCAGDATQKCGGSFALSVVNNTAYTAPVFVARSSYTTWNLNACYIDNPSSRTLNHIVSLSGSGGSANATVAHCLDACKAAGYMYCGVEYYAECYGSMGTPLAANKLAGDPIAAGCGYTCKGNATEACGGSNRVLVYVNNGTAQHVKRRGLMGRKVVW